MHSGIFPHCPGALLLAEGPSWRGQDAVLYRLKLANIFRESATMARSSDQPISLLFIGGSGRAP